MDIGRNAGRLLDQLDVLRHPSDLDLLIFFARHPRTLLSSEQIAAFLGYGVKEVAVSLELLLEAGFVTRTPNPRHVARLYLLVDSPPGGGWLPGIKRLATTRQGRLALIWEIRRRTSAAQGDTTSRGGESKTAVPDPLRFPQRPETGSSRGKQATAPAKASGALKSRSGGGAKR